MPMMVPAKGPWILIASYMYWEQVGKNLQEETLNGESSTW